MRKNFPQKTASLRYYLVGLEHAINLLVRFHSRCRANAIYFGSRSYMYVLLSHKLECAVEQCNLWRSPSIQEVEKFVSISSVSTERIWHFLIRQAHALLTNSYNAFWYIFIRDERIPHYNENYTHSLFQIQFLALSRVYTALKPSCIFNVHWFERNVSYIRDRSMCNDTRGKKLHLGTTPLVRYVR